MILYYNKYFVDQELNFKHYNWFWSQCFVFRVFAGASEEGVEGFFKGIGKGLLGLITQPLGGVMDMVSMAFDGLRR